MLTKEMLEIIKNAISLIEIDDYYDINYNLNYTLNTTRAIEYIDSKIEEVDKHYKEMADFIGHNFKITKE